MKGRKGVFSIFLGLLLIAAALFLTAYNLQEEARAEESARQVIDRLAELFPPETEAEKPALPDEEPDVSEAPRLPDYVQNPDMEMPVKTVDGIDYIGVLAVPSLDLELPIISQWSYPSLKKAPCRYSGSAYAGDLIIAAHNYSSHFGNLKKLQEGDAITFTDMEGNIFFYEVAVLEILMPTAVEEMESGNWDLTLFTCTIGGKSRVTIRCELVESRPG